jgi:hypothetical protein
MHLVIAEQPVYGPGTVKGQVDAIGAGPNYATVIGTTPFVFELRHYQDFNGKDAGLCDGAFLRFVYSAGLASI